MSANNSFADYVSQAVEGGVDFARLRPGVESGLAKLLSHTQMATARRMLFTGSGDSLFAAQSAVPLLRRWTGVAASALSAIEFARYELPLLCGEDVVWGVSNSGSASRTREAVMLARERGNLTVGVTGSKTGPLAELAECVLYRPVNALDDIDPRYRRVFLNMVEYLAALYALYLSSLQIAVKIGRMDASTADGWVEKIEADIKSLGGMAGAHDSMAGELARELQALDTLWVIGAGPSYGTARYCAAKYHEQIPINGIPEDLEEWAHLQYFLTLNWGARSVVIVLAPPGNSLDRAEELVEGIAGAGGRPVVVASPGHGRFPKAFYRFDVPGVEDEFLSPLTYHLPSQLLVLHLARLAEVPLTPLRREDEYFLIRKGVVLNDGGGLR